MKTLSSFLALAALGCSSTFLVVGCGCDPGNNSVREAVGFTPSSLDAVRTAPSCGPVAPGFGVNDTFTLKLLGETDVAPPYTLVTVAVTSAVAPNEAVPLMVSPGDSPSVTNARSNDGAIQFSFATGSNSSELDAAPLTSVVVTPTSIPTADGEPLGVELRLTFEDGRELDQVYSAPLETVAVPCQ